MSGQSAKRHETAALALASVPGIDSLPPELLETIFGLLDVGTLCTARLVCAHFRGAASRCLHSVELSVETLRRRPETTLKNFPNLSRVSVFGVKENDLRMLAQSPVAAAVTHLRAVEYLRPVPRRTRNAPGLRLVPLPNLTSLTVSHTLSRPSSFPQTLRDLSLEAPVDFRTANLVAALTNLTCLQIDVSKMVGSHLPDKPLAAVTALATLKRLEICSGLSVIPFVAELALLTHLQFDVDDRVFLPDSPSDLAHLASLARLHRLVHLGITHIDESMGHQVLSSLLKAAFTGLKSLQLDVYGYPEQSASETVCMAPFSQLTALRLRYRRFEGSLLPRFNLERLQDLSISHMVVFSGEEAVALTRATGLTHLSLEKVGASMVTALSRMSRLRALSLGHHYAAHVTSSLKAIALLTDLSRLELSGWSATTNAAVDVCLGLRKLRVLRLVAPPCLKRTPISSDHVIHKIFFAIAKLQELRNVVVNRGGDLMDEVPAWLNAERQAKGWPPLELGV